MIPAPDINPDDYFCDLCGTPITRGEETKCITCQITDEYIITPLKARIKALEADNEAYKNALADACDMAGCKEPPIFKYCKAHSENERIKALEGVVEEIKDAVKWINDNPDEGYERLFIFDIETALKKPEEV